MDGHPSRLVSQLGLVGGADDRGAERAERRLVGRMLRRRVGDVDRIARQVGQLAFRERRTDGARDRDEHATGSAACAGRRADAPSGTG